MLLANAQTEILREGTAAIRIKEQKVSSKIAIAKFKARHLAEATAQEHRIGSGRARTVYAAPASPR
jgi:hypothetical protein